MDGWIGQVEELSPKHGQFSALLCSGLHALLRAVARSLPTTNYR